MNFLDGVLSQSEETPDNKITYLCETPISCEKADVVSHAHLRLEEPLAGSCRGGRREIDRVGCEGKCLTLKTRWSDFQHELQISQLQWVLNNIKSTFILFIRKLKCSAEK